jgi:hypothetical protein
VDAALPPALPAARPRPARAHDWALGAVVLAEAAFLAFKKLKSGNRKIGA